MENSKDENLIDLRKVFSILYHNILAITTITVLCAVLGFVISAFALKPTYSASAKMIVNNSKQQTSQTITYSDLTAATNLVDTYSVILKSHSVLQKVITDLNLDCDYNQLAKAITIEAEGTTQVMHISVLNSDRDTALKIAQKIVELAPSAIMNATDSGSVKTVDEPWSDPNPVSPNKAQNAAVAAVLGFVVSIAIIALRETLNNKFKSVEDLQKVLDLPVLGVIPLEDAVSGK